MTTDTTTMDFAAVAALGDELLDWRMKGMPPDRPPVRLGDLGAQGWHALDGTLPMPVLLLRRSALHHNIALLARVCREHGVGLAPHGKTTMAPQILAEQVRAGCWALTAATPAHLRVYRRFGVQRVLYANQLLEPAVLRWVAREMDADEDFEILALVDGPDGVAAMDAILATCEPARLLGVLVEHGHPGGRAGARTTAAALETAYAVESSDHLALAGIEAFEGTIARPTLAATLSAVDALLEACLATADALMQDGLLDRPLLSAGGSAYLDRVLAVATARPDVEVVLRSGCTVVHDGGFYERVSPLAGRAGGGARLRGALELWSLVQSRPQADLAILGAGKRDVGQDLGPPVPIALRRVDGSGREPWPGTGIVAALSDQHAHVRVDPDSALAVGDRVGMAVSHPCTTLDKWRLVLAVDDEDRVVDGVLTFF